MLIAKSGDTVKVHYTGKHEDGQIFDTSQEREPLEFVLGAGQMIKGFEKAVLGMSVGAEKTITLKPEEGYGEVNPEMVFPVKRQDIPDTVQLQIGTQLSAQTAQGQSIQVVVKEIGDEEVLLDANHPLAGKNLVFELHLVEVTPEGQAGQKPLLFD